MKEYKKQYKIKEKPELKLEGKDRYGNVQQIKKTFLNDVEFEGGQGTHESKLVETPEYQALIVRTYEYLKAAIPSNQILHTYMMEDESMTEGKFAQLLKYTYQYGENELHKDREYIFQLHMKRYEDLYRECMVMQDSWHRPLDPKKDWYVITRKYAAAVKALKAKEELLGLHNKSVVLEFSDNKALIIEKETMRGGANQVAGFDLDKLEVKELAELLTLIKDIRTTPIEGIQRVSIKQVRIEISSNGERSLNELVKTIDMVNTKGIIFEDMPEDVVGKFEDVTVIEEDVQIKEPNVIDSVPKEYRKKKVANEEDVKEQIRVKTLEELKKRLKKD